MCVGVEGCERQARENESARRSRHAWETKQRGPPHEAHKRAGGRADKCSWRERPDTSAQIRRSGANTISNLYFPRILLVTVYIVCKYMYMEILVFLVKYGNTCCIWVFFHGPSAESSRKNSPPLSTPTNKNLLVFLSFPLLFMAHGSPLATHVCLIWFIFSFLFCCFGCSALFYLFL
jgi:hypothetical protein